MEMSIQEKFFNYPVEDKIDLIEKFDKDKLKLIIDNFDELYDKIGKFCDFANGYKKIQQKATNKTILETLYRKKKVTYKPSASSKDGRLFGAGSLQGINKIVRHTLCKDLCYDYDIKNAHNVFLTNYCNWNGISYKNLKYYNDNRDNLLTELMEAYNLEKDDAKKIVLTLINGGGGDYLNNKNAPDWLYNLKTEIDLILKKVCELNPELYNKIKKKKEWNPEGTTLNHILCKMENIVIQVFKKWCEKNEIDINTICFDGLLLMNKIDTQDVQDYIKKELNIEVQIVEKEMNEELNLDKYIAYKNIENKYLEKEYITKYDEEIFFDSNIDITREDYYWIDFEKKYCYTIFDSYIELYREAVKDIPRVLAKLTMGKGFYIKKEHSDLLCSVVKLKDLDRIFFQYKGFKCDKEGKPEIQTISIDKLYINLKLPLYSHPDIILDKNLKSNAYNMFKGIQASKVDYIDYTLIDDFFKHLKDIICDGNQDEFHFFNSWIRWIIIHPHIKSKVFTFLYSGEGYGKTSIGDLLSKYIFGHSASYICAGLESVIGNFNRHLEGKIFCQIEELPSTSETFHSQFNKMKHYITDDKFSITPKGIDSYKVNNYLNFLGCSNNKYSLRMSAGDTRYFVLEIKKKMNSDYWKDYYNKFQNQKFGDMLYSYYLQTNDSDYVDFHGRPEIPMNNLKRELIDFSMSSYDRFYKDIMEGEYLLSKNIIMKPFVYKNIEYKYATTLNDLYNQFLDWAYINGVKDMNRKYLDFTKLHTGKFRFIDLQQRITNINELTFVVDYDKPPVRLLVEEGLDL